MRNIAADPRFPKPGILRTLAYYSGPLAGLHFPCSPWSGASVVCYSPASIEATVLPSRPLAFRSHPPRPAPSGGGRHVPPAASAPGSADAGHNRRDDRDRP
ncbi:hypothetical protein GCM10017562_67410 [Streptomyces roseofulvus]